MAGAGYKLFNTGDVLTAAQVNTYLQEQVVMVFADAAARTTALSGVLAEGMVSYLKSTKVVEIYNGTAWASLDDPNAIQNSIVDAKGDLIAATGNDVPARLAVGSNGDTLVADSAATTGLRWQSVNTGNFVVNGLFDNWQRGTSGTFTNSVVYPAADRFFAVCTGTAPTCTMSRQTADTTNLQYGLRFGRNSGQTNTGSPYVGTALETGTTKLLAGQTITVSLYIKRGADAPTNLTVGLYTSTGTDQSAAGIFSGAWASAAYAFQTAQATTTTMTRYSFTTTLGSTINQVALLCSYSPTGTAGANEWFQIEGVQIEVGSVATAVRRSGGTIQGELAACEYYYQRFNLVGTGAGYGAVCVVAFNSSSVAWGAAKLKRTMRTAPSVARSGTWETTYGTPSTFTSDANQSTKDVVTWGWSAGSGGTTGYAATIRAQNDSNAYWEASAEL